jgi:hypothetical protein
VLVVVDNDCKRIMLFCFKGALLVSNWLILQERLQEAGSPIVGCLEAGCRNGAGLCCTKAAMAQALQ